MLLIAAIAIALSSLAIMAVQNVMAALDTLPGAGSLAPGNQFAHEIIPNNPYKFAPGEQFEHGFSPNDPYRFAPGQLADVGTGPG